MQPSRALLPFALLLAACGSTSPDAAPPPRPEISVDPATCESSAETIATIDGTGATLMEAMAVAPDGTVYFAREEASDTRGLFAIDPGGGAPRRVSPFGFANRMWVDGDSVVVADFGRVYRVPRAGGDAVQVGAIPKSDEPAGPLASAHAFDGAHVYLASMTLLDGAGHQKNDVWRIPKSGGDAELLFTSNDDQYKGLWNSQIVFDDTSLYIGADGSEAQDFGVLMKMPKTGGTPVLLRAKAYDPLGNALALVGTDLYAPPFYGKLTRWPLDPSGSPTEIEHEGAVTGLVADGATAYVALLTIDHAPPVAKSVASRVAFARVPNGVEHTTSIGCTGFGDGLGWVVRSMALDPTHLYALAWDDAYTSNANRYEILRMPR